MTEEQKEELLKLSAKTTEAGHQFLDWLEDLHEKSSEYIPDENELDNLVDDDIDFDKAQKAMDELHERMVKLGIS